MKRRRISRRGGRKLFKATASKVNFKNLRAVPMRGGYRI